MRALRARAPILKSLAARKAYEQERYRGTERRQQLRAESRLELFFRMGAALTITRRWHRHAVGGHQAPPRWCRLALQWSASLQHPLVSLSTTRELCAVAGAQNVVRDHIALFGMLLHVYSEGVETITRSVSYVKFRAPWDWDTPYLCAVTAGAAVDLLWRHAVPSLPPPILWMLGGGQGLLTRSGFFVSPHLI